MPHYMIDEKGKKIAVPREIETSTDPKKLESEYL